MKTIYTTFRRIILLFSLALLIATVALVVARQDTAATAWQIITSRREDNDHELYRVLPNGSGLKRLTYRPARERIVTWSPDGQWFYFRSQLDSIVFRMNIWGDNMEIFGPGHIEFYTLSPNREWFVVRMLEGIYRIRPDGSEFSLITTLKSGSIVNFSRWSLDGKWLYFNEWYSNSFQYVWRVQYDDGERQTVSPMDTNVHLAGLAPDQTHLILRQYYATYYLTQLDGSNSFPLTSDTDAFDILETESPDHKWILTRRVSLVPDTVQSADGSEPPTHINLYRMSPDGSDDQAVTSFVGYQLSSISWETDGWIYFQAEIRNVAPNIFRVRSDGTDLQQLTNGYGVLLQWSPDRQQIIFASSYTETALSPTGGTTLYEMRPDGSDIRPLPSDFQDYPKYQSPYPIDLNWHPTRLLILSLLAIIVPYLAYTKKLLRL